MEFLKEMNLRTTDAVMITTSQFLDLCRDKLGSDYKTSLALGKHDSYVSNMRGRDGVLPDEMAAKVAEILDFPLDSIILCMSAERALKGGHIELASKLHAIEEAQKSQENSKITGTH